jgi:hypothetical protein
MKPTRPCPHGGSPLPSEGYEGLCPNCVVRVSLEQPPAKYFQIRWRGFRGDVAC